MTPGSELTAAGASRGNIVQLIQLDNIVHGLFVTSPHRLAYELWKPSVKWGLSSFEARSDRSSSSRLLPPHTKTTRSTLPGRDTTALSLLSMARPRGRLEIVKSEHCVVQII